ncbi:unnamed protein product, partial [Closterium sp. NIES-54]
PHHTFDLDVPSASETWTWSGSESANQRQSGSASVSGTGTAHGDEVTGCGRDPSCSPHAPDETGMREGGKERYSRADKMKERRKKGMTGCGRDPSCSPHAPDESRHEKGVEREV